MTRTSHRQPRRSKVHHYRPTRVNLSEYLTQPSTSTATPRVMYVQDPYYGQMECGDKVVEARPYYPCFHDLSPGQLVEFSHHPSGSSFVVRITHKRVHRDVVTMLRQETIRSCLPDHDPQDLQGAVNTYYSFRDGSYRHLTRKYRVVSFRFTHVGPDCNNSDPNPWGEYDKNSLCSIFSAVDRVCPRSKVTW